MKHFGYLVDLSTVQLDENGNVSWIQAFPLGKWNHPVYGEIEMTSARAEKLAANVQANVRGQDLNIDYDHQSGEAAGWVKNAEARADGLWLAVEWTKEAAEKIKNKVYRYFSPEYADEWEDPRTKTKHTDVLFGGGITNRPFLKGILPLNLSEAFATQTNSEETGESVDPKLVRAALKLSETATDEEVTAALTKLSEPAPNPKPDDEQKKLDDQKVMDDAKTLAETDPVVKALFDRITILEGSSRLNEVELALKSLDEPGDKVTIAPAVIEQAKTAILNAPKAVGDEIMKLLKEIKKNGVVKLTEEGRTPTDVPGGGSKTATQEYMEKSSKYAEDNKVPLADAMSFIAGAEPKLFDEYRNESYLRERGQ